MRHGSGSSGWKFRGGDLHRLLPQFLEQNAAEVAFAEGRQDDDDQLALVLGALGNFQRRYHRGAGGDPDKESLFFGKAARHVDGFVVRNGDDFIDVVPAKNAGDKSCANALDLVRGRLASGENGAVSRLDCDSFEGRLLGLDVFADTGDGSACAHAGNEDVDAAVGVIPDFGASGFEVNLGIGRVIKLLQDVAVGILGKNLLCL